MKTDVTHRARPGRGARQSAVELVQVGIAPVAALGVGSAFNIWYNSLHVVPLLSPVQQGAFFQTIWVFNALVYPVLLGLWILRLISVYPMLVSEDMDRDRRLTLRRRIINLPWVGVGLAASGWAACAVVFPVTLWASSGAISPVVLAHLLTSFAISGSIAMTVAFFLLEILTQRLLYPLAFRSGHPLEVPGARPLNLARRGLLGALATGAFPILSLLLLILSPHEKTPSHAAFAIAVAVAGILSGVLVARLLSQLIVTPIHALRDASQAVADGDLDARIDMLRADEFGRVIEEFNTLVAGLREKRELEETFGRHVGRAIARKILAARRGLTAQQQEVSVLFLDIRGFTTRCEADSPETSVAVLNLFLDQMVEVIERHDGIVNKFLGDGLMALFGAAESSSSHPEQSTRCALALFASLSAVNTELARRQQAPLAIGIGLHCGPATVGNIGSARRLEFTAIGDTVNLAARIQELTKETGYPLLITGSVQTRLDPELAKAFRSLGEKHIRGKTQSVDLWGIDPTRQ